MTPTVTEPRKLITHTLFYLRLCVIDESHVIARATPTRPQMHIRDEEAVGPNPATPTRHGLLGSLPL